MKKVDEYVQ